MITVNLLPFELRPVKRTPLPYIAGGAVLAVTLLVVAVFYLLNDRAARKWDATLQDNLNQLADLEDLVADYNRLSQTQLDLKTKVETISEITSDRIIWSEQLAHLARLALDNFWYDGIKVGTRSVTTNVTEIDPKTKKPKTKKKVTQMRILTISGFVMGGGGEGALGPFIEKTGEDEEFSKLFVMSDIGGLEDTVFNDKPVKRFEVEYLIRPAGDR